MRYAYRADIQRLAPDINRAASIDSANFWSLFLTLTIEITEIIKTTKKRKKYIIYFLTNCMRALFLVDVKFFICHHKRRGGF